jgi:CRP/FNR family cyclic AMP-dependent transcriptional regulator
MGAQQSAHTPMEASGEMIELFFLKAGKMRELRPGERLISEGAKVTSLFLISEGSLVLRKKTDGHTKTVATREKGALLGELSLLLGQPATVTIEAPQDAEVRVAEMAQEELLDMLYTDPKLAGGFFRLLGATLGERISEISQVMRKSVLHTSSPHHGPHAQAVSVLPASLDRAVAVVCKEFGLPTDTEMLLHCDVSMTIEENSVTDNTVHNAKM